MRRAATATALALLALLPAVAPALGPGPGRSGAAGPRALDGDRVPVARVELAANQSLRLDANVTTLDPSAFELDRRTRILDLAEGATGGNLRAAVVVEEGDGRRLAALEAASFSAELVHPDAGNGSAVASEALVTFLDEPRALVAEHWDLAGEDGATFACPKAVVSSEAARYSSASRRPTVTVPAGASSELTYGPGAEGCPQGTIRYAFLGLWRVA